MLVPVVVRHSRSGRVENAAVWRTGPELSGFRGCGPVPATLGDPVRDHQGSDQRRWMFGVGGVLPIPLPMKNPGCGGWLYAVFCQATATRYCGSCIRV